MKLSDLMNDSSSTYTLYLLARKEGDLSDVYSWASFQKVEIDTTPGQTTSQLVTNLSAGDNTVSGSTFDYTISTEPIVISIFDSNGYDLSDTIQKRFIKNGLGYDIYVYTTDPLTSVKIKVVC